MNITYILCDVQVMLNPQPELSDLPIKSYYRYALPSFNGSAGIT